MLNKHSADDGGDDDCYARLRPYATHCMTHYQLFSSLSLSIIEIEITIVIKRGKKFLFSPVQMNFQRSQSKVWFGSQQHSAYDNFYSLPAYYNAQKKSLQSISEQHEESMSPKNSSSEGDDLKRSMLIWGNRKSPSSQSHKSQVRTNERTE